MFEGRIAAENSSADAADSEAEHVGFRESLSRIRALMLTALGSPQGFFTQYPYAEHLQPVGEPYPEVEALCADVPLHSFLGEIAQHREVFRRFGASDLDPVLGRGMFSTLDGMAAYAAVRKFKPKRIVEIGSGDSTFFLARGVRDNGQGVITCIDPKPQRDITALNVDFQPRIMTSADAEMAGDLEENEILFIDSSHIMLPGMDVDILFNRLFPRLKKGVVVHIHDIFLPDDYPPHWQTRNFSEQTALIGWLISDFFEILWPGHYALTRRPDLVLPLIPSQAPNTGAGSLWLRRR